MGFYGIDPLVNIYLHNSGKSLLSIGKLTSSMVIFKSYVTVITRGYPENAPESTPPFLIHYKWPFSVAMFHFQRVFWTVL